MTIRQRITLLIALTFATLAAIGGFAVVQASRSATKVKSVTEGVVPSALQSVALLTQLKDVQIAALNMVSAIDATTVEQTHAALKARQSELQSSLAAQLKTADSPAQVGLVKQAQESLANYFAAIDDTARFKLAGQKELAEASMAGTVDQYLREQGEIMQTLQIEKNRSKDAAIASLNGDMRRTQLTLSAVSICAVLGLCAIGYLLYRQIVRPVGEMERKMTEIATSQDFTHRVPVTRMDEIGKSMVAFNAMVEKIQQSTELVRQKTADIHAMLHAIPQGILTLEAGGRVHPEYSDFLRHILETGDIAGQDVMAAVFAGTTLGDDAAAQLETAIGSCIGEDGMNFEFNAHLLPAEIEKAFADGRTKILDLNWSPMTDAHGTITRLLLCVRDVTELRELARAADARKRELAIIGEILGMTHDRFAGFVEESLSFIEQSAALVARATAGTDADRADAVPLLFRHMHTIKGNARTYGLAHLTDVVHRIEETCDQLRAGSIAWDAARLEQALAQGRAAIDEYVSIGETKLGRRAPEGRGGAGESRALSGDQFAHLLGKLDLVDAADPVALRSVLHEVRHAMRRAGAERIEDVLSGVFDSLPSLARELGKPEPLLDVEDHGILVQNGIAATLRNVFTHLYRNAIDHGIELPDARIAAGKAPCGSIRLEAALDERHLTLTLQDDGRGLALRHLVAKARAKGLVAEGQAMATPDIANLIFAPGFSTARAVSQVSGRGAGMDAVKGFVEAAGGAIELELLDAAGEFTPFRIVVTLPAGLGIARSSLESDATAVA